MSTDSAETKRTPEGSPCWVELMADDVQALQQFYSSIFPSWEFQPASEEHKDVAVAHYTFKQPSGLSGGIIKRPEECKPGKQSLGIGQTVYFSVESIDKTVEKVHTLGGSTLLGKNEEGTNGWYANLQDPQGNRFGIYEVNRVTCGGA